MSDKLIFDITPHGHCTPVDVDSGGGLVGFIGWHRLLNVLIRDGEIAAGERVKRIVVDGRGISYTVEQI